MNSAWVNANWRGMLIGLLVLVLLLSLWFGGCKNSDPPAKPTGANNAELKKEVDELRSKNFALENKLNPPPGTPVGPSANAKGPSAPPPATIESRVTALDDGLKNEATERKAADSGLVKIVSDVNESVKLLAADAGKTKDILSKVDNVAVSALMKANDGEKRIDALVGDLAETQSGLADVKGQLASLKTALQKTLAEEKSARVKLEQKQDAFQKAQTQASIAKASAYVRTTRLAETRVIQAEAEAENARRLLEKKEAERVELESRVRQMEENPPTQVNCGRRALLPWNR